VAPAAPEISVVIVTWNSRDVVLGCLDALAEHAPARPWEVIVVDNGSTDGTAHAVRAHSPSATVIANRCNRGLPAANNQGIAAASGRFVLIANPDTAVGPGAVDALADLVERQQRAAFAVPRLRHPDGRLQVSAGDLPTLREALLGRQAQRREPDGDQGFWWDGWAHDAERQIGRGHEACYLVRRAALDDIGLQDEAFFLDWEGIDWTARARAAGWEVWFTPRADVVHIGGTSIRQVPLRWIVGSHRGMYRYFAKRTKPALRPALAAVVTARGVAKAAAAAIGPAAYERANGA
jgi:N-acetylglucosaminyl-diphospho-decaprenol L-rhamnosyltransferase